MRKALIFTLIISSLALAACGFHFKDQTGLPKELGILHLNSDDPYSPFTKQLRHTLINAGSKVIDDVDVSTFTLVISHEKHSAQEKAVSANTQVREYTLNYEIYYSLYDKNHKVVVKTQKVFANRNYIANNNQVLGATHQRETLLKEMRRDIALQIINRLQSPVVAKKLG